MEKRCEHLEESPREKEGAGQDRDVQAARRLHGEWALDLQWHRSQQGRSVRQMASFLLEDLSVTHGHTS